MELTRLDGLLHARGAAEWGRQICALANELGFEQTLFALLPTRHAAHAEAFITSNYSTAWLDKYERQQFTSIDPTFNHAKTHALPLIWSPQIYKTQTQRDFFEEASGHGLHSGLSFPIHGNSGEFGIFSFASVHLKHSKAKKDLEHALPCLSLLRDYAHESAKAFVRPPTTQPSIALTRREREVLQWIRDGKSSWEIGRILNCSEDTVKFHTTNVRGKFGVKTRQQAVVKAIHLGLIEFE